MMTTVIEKGRTRSAVAAEAVAACSFSMAEEYTTAYLRRAEDGGPGATIRVPWFGALPMLQHRVTFSFGLHLDINEKGRRHDEVRVRWSAGTAFLPDFRGTIRFRIDGNQTRVLLDGSYAPPLGAAGGLFDRIAGSHIAHASVQDLANRIATYLTEQERTWRLAQPA